MGKRGVDKLLLCFSKTKTRCALLMESCILHWCKGIHKNRVFVPDIISQPRGQNFEPQLCLVLTLAHSHKWVNFAKI